MSAPNLNPFSTDMDELTIAFYEEDLDRLHHESHFDAFIEQLEEIAKQFNFKLRIMLHVEEPSTSDEESM